MNTSKPEQITLLKCDLACAVLSKSVTAFYVDMENGLIPRPVSIGGRGRRVAWPDYELQAIARARIAGKTDDEVRKLVKKQMDDRKLLA